MICVIYLNIIYQQSKSIKVQTLSNCFQISFSASVFLLGVSPSTVQFIGGIYFRTSDGASKDGLTAGRTVGQADKRTNGRTERSPRSCLVGYAAVWLSAAKMKWNCARLWTRSVRVGRRFQPGQILLICMCIVPPTCCPLSLSGISTSAPWLFGPRQSQHFGQAAPFAIRHSPFAVATNHFQVPKDSNRDKNKAQPAQNRKPGQNQTPQRALERPRPGCKAHAMFWRIRNIYGLYVMMPVDLADCVNCFWEWRTELFS